MYSIYLFYLTCQIVTRMWLTTNYNECFWVQLFLLPGRPTLFKFVCLFVFYMMWHAVVIHVLYSYAHYFGLLLHHSHQFKTKMGCKPVPTQRNGKLSPSLMLWLLTGICWCIDWSWLKSFQVHWLLQVTWASNQVSKRSQPQDNQFLSKKWNYFQSRSSCCFSCRLT